MTRHSPVTLQAIDAHAADNIALGLHLIPHHMIEGIVEHVFYGTPAGGFLTKLLSNDFFGAAAAADSSNLAALPRWADFLYNHVPAGCKGSPEAVITWREHGGLAGLAAARDAAKEG